MNPLFCKIHALPRFSGVLPRSLFALFSANIRSVLARSCPGKQRWNIFKNPDPCNLYFIVARHSPAGGLKQEGNFYRPFGSCNGQHSHPGKHGSYGKMPLLRRKDR
jgi:hypothetical protein